MSEETSTKQLSEEEKSRAETLAIIMGDDSAAASAAAAADSKKKSSRIRAIPAGIAHINASFNNTDRKSVV